ncbi:MAG TPA: outer membrane beta-barrel protein [Chitinophagaceae bacterium]|nr:outer membrane beta-barrel protein [Chitinophagaceae bacterium]
MNVRKQCMKALPLVFLTLIAGMSANAQIVKKAYPEYGISANVHYSTITGFGGGSGRIVPDIGVFAQIPIQTRSSLYSYNPVHLYIVPQIEYSMRGETRETKSGDVNFHYNYINIPIYAKYYIKGFNIVKGDKIFAMVGPEIGFNVVKNEGDLANISDTEERMSLKNTLENFNEISFGVSVVGGYSFPFGLEGFVRLDKGFTDIYRGATEDGARANHIKLGVGINWVIPY